VFVFVGVTVGFTTDVGDVVLVVGVVVVLFVIVGLTVGLTVGVVTFGKVVLDVSDGLVVKGTLGASVVFGTLLVLVVKDAGGLVGSVGFGAVGKVGFAVGLVTVEVIGGRIALPPEGADGLTPLPVDTEGRVTLPVVVAGRLGRAPEPSEVREPDVRPVNEGRSLKLRMTLSSGARSSPLASGSLLLDVRFFRIAMSYPVFFTNEVRPAILLTGLNFAVLANVFAGCTGVAF